ncbi:MAG TPA: hypothetical protein VGW75_08280 [Solirubrobacteraceae bacterium]|nr:hypothetical protein [Solirubrobacteraceae bacterium]
MPWDVEFFEDDEGRQPARTFIERLTPDKRAALIAAIELILAVRGPDVCKSEFGKALGHGLFEFRVRHDEATITRRAGVEPSAKSGRSDVLLRMFFCVYGERVVLLLGGYDKGADPAARRQSREIEAARKRLRSFKLRQERRATGRRRRRT